MAIMALNKVQHRAHIRVICIDGQIGWTGGFGIDDKWFGNGRTKNQWRDSNVRFTGPAVNQLQAAFAACWAESTGDLLIAPVQVHEENDTSISPRARLDRRGFAACVAVRGSTEAERFFYLLDRERANEAVHHELILRPGPRHPRANRGGRAARCRHAHPDGERGERTSRARGTRDARGTRSC
jgi:phosphatidylserine/phosphatidylglycerophosphate/cardiolipin synthase-like enzyme